MYTNIMQPSQPNNGSTAHLRFSIIKGTDKGSEHRWSPKLTQGREGVGPDIPVFIYEQSDQWRACHQASPEHQPHKL